eukprot:12693819-Ditylum_brightwellii.AAC.1
MENCNPAVAPTSGPKPLGPDPHGRDAQLQDKWSYASVVGMIMYLASNSRQEITFAVHQCARFTHGTKHFHEKTFYRSADADFDGLFSVEDLQDVIL